MTPLQVLERFDDEQKAFQESQKAAQDAVAKLRDLAERSQTLGEPTCAQLLQIAQAASSARMAQDTVATNAQTLLQNLVLIEDAAWNTYWEHCPE